MMDKDRINALGEELYTALRSQATLAPLTEREADITIEDAYHISLRMMDLRLERDGERIVGKKIGVTSKPVQDMLGVFQPDFGFLTNTMEYPDGADIAIAIKGGQRLIQIHGSHIFGVIVDLGRVDCTENLHCVNGHNIVGCDRRGGQKGTGCRCGQQKGT